MREVRQGSGGAATAEAEAYAHLLDRIRHGQLAPGTRLRAEEIADAIGMSRMPVREALRRLDTEGFVTLRPNRGAVVTGYATDEIVELFEMRSVLEGLAARLAAPGFGRPQVLEARDLLTRMVRAEADMDQWIARHQDLHRFIAALAGRPRLLREIERMHTVLEPSLRLWFGTLEQPLSSKQDHAALIDALATRDGATAEAAMRAHVLKTGPLVARFLAGPDDETGAAPSPARRTRS